MTEDEIITKLAGAINKSRSEMGEDYPNRESKGSKPTPTANEPERMTGKLPNKGMQVLKTVAKRAGPIGAALTIGELIEQGIDMAVTSQANKPDVTPLNMKSKQAGQTSEQQESAMAQDAGGNAMQANFEAVLLGQTASQSMNVANARANLVQTDVGVMKPQTFAREIEAGGRVLGTFGDTTYRDQGNTRFINFKKTEAVAPVKEKDTTINTNAAASSMVNGTPVFNVAQEFAKVRALTDPAAREDAAQLLYVNIAQQATTISTSITEQARQRAGVNDAKSALDSYVAIENQMKANGQIPQYASSMQVRQARETYAKTLAMANAEETDMLKNNPQLNAFKRYDQLLSREFTQTDRLQAKQDSVASQLPPMSNENLANVKYATGLETDSVQQLSSAALNALKNDKDFARIIQADKNTLPGLLVDPDPKIRQYAYRVLVGSEKAQNNGEIPDYVKILEPIVADRQAVLKADTNKDALKGFSTATTKAVGAKAQDEASTTYLLNHLNTVIQKTTERHYTNMNNWTYLNADMKAIVEGVQVNNKSKAVLMSDGVDAIMKAKMKNPDGTEMLPTEKIKQLVASLEVSMKGSKPSVLLPSAEYYIGPMSAELRNTAMRSYIQSATISSELNILRNTPFFNLPGMGGN